MNRYLLGLLFFLILFLAGCDSGTREELFAQGMAASKSDNPQGAAVFFRNALERDPNYYEARYELAKAFMTVGKTELAEKEFLKLLQQDTTRDEVRLELARAYIVNRKSDKAVQEINEYVKIHGVNSDTNELLGITSVLQNQPIAAESYLLQALASDSSRTKIKRELVTVYVQFRMKDKLDDARRLIRELLQVDPKDTRAYYLLAELELLAGERNKALVNYQMIVGLDSGDFNALYQAGILQANKGDLAAAAQIAQTLVQKFPKRGEGTRLSGIVNFHNKEYVEAIANLLRSLQLSPTDEANYYLGLSFYSNGDLESALSQFFKLTDKTVYAEPSRLLAGMILLKQQRIDDAIVETRKLLAVQPGHALGHNILGSALMSKGLYEEGMKEFNRAIELDPGLIDAHLKKGVFHLNEGRLQDAERDFSSAVQAAPQLLNTRQILTCFYLRENQPERAITVLKQGLDGEKSDAILYDNLAAISFSQNKRKEGLAYLLKAEKSNPDYAPARFHLATYYAVDGTPEKALNEYRRLLEKDPVNLAALLNMAALLEFNNRDSEALGVYHRAKESKAGDAYLALADYLMRKSQEVEALAILNEARQEIPGNLAVWQMKFRIHLKRREFKDAIQVAAEIEGLDPQLGLRRRVETYIAMKDEVKALETAEEFATIHPNSAYGYMMQSLIYEEKNEFDQAVKVMQQGIRAERGNIDALVQLGNLYARKKDYTSAQAVYDEALRKDVNAVSVLFAQGVLLEARGNKVAAIKKYLDVLQKAADHVAALNNLAYLYANGYGSPQEGLRLAFLAYRLEPGNPLLMDTLGVALLKNGRSSDACKLLEKAARLMPETPTVAYHLALAYRDSGQKDQARKILKEISARSDFPEAGEAKKTYVYLSEGR